MPRSRPASNPVSYHKHTNQYYVTRGGRRVYLGSDEEEALKQEFPAMGFIGHLDHTHGLGGYLVGFKKILPIQQKNTEKRLITDCGAGIISS